MPSIGAILWGSFVILDMWRALRADDPTWALLLRGSLSLATVLMIAAGWSITFLITGLLLQSAALVLVGLSILLMPPPLPKEVAWTVMDVGFKIVFTALCWALS